MLKARSPLDCLFANVEWKCTACGQPRGCDCWIKCECGHNHLRGEECSNQIWHISKQFADEAADLIVADMAQSYRMFQREHMIARLKRAVVRHAQPIILATFEGVEAARAEREQPRTKAHTSAPVHPSATAALIGDEPNPLLDLPAEGEQGKVNP